MAEAMDLRSITKFNGSNFQTWKFQMKSLFIVNGLTSIVDGSCERTSSNQNEWDKYNAKAMVIISSTVESSQLEYLLTCETANNMWKRLSAIYEQKSESNKLLLMTKFHDYKMAQNDSIAQHVAKIENTARQLKDLGENVSDLTIMAKILGSLPSKFSAFVTAWDSVDASKQTIDNLAQRLIKEEGRMNATDEMSGALAAMSLKPNQERRKTTEKRMQQLKKEITCFYCQKRGHMARECRKKKREQNTRERLERRGRNETASNSSAFTAEAHVDEVLGYTTDNSWLLDSGASRHMTFRHEWFTDIQPCEDQNVSIGNGTNCKVKGQGTIHIKRLINGKWLDGTLEDVLYVPSLNKNLFSIGACTNKNYKVIFKHNLVELLMDDEIKAQGLIQSNNLFRMLIKVQRNNENNVVALSSLRRWHERLGHVNHRYIQQLKKDGLISEALTDDDNNEDLFCEACQYGKQHRLAFKNTTKRKLLPGELVHSDVCGPMSQDSIGGSRYYVSFKDDCSAYRMVYFIKHKSDVMDKLVEFVNLIENKFQRKVRILRTDNGKEYCNERMSRYLSSKGILLETTAPYTPEQNGRAERDNRTLVESARAMLYAKDMPTHLWAEAVNTACYILNRTPTSCNQNKTPYEVWIGKPPRLDHIRVFGSEAYVHVPKQFRNKWDKKSQKMIFVGYQADSRNYRLYNPLTKKITVSRDVVIHETNSHSIESPNEDTRIPIDHVFQLQGDTQTENITKDVAEEDEQTNTDDNQQVVTRILRDRSTIKPPQRYEANITEFDEPKSYQEAISGGDAENWKRAINEELKAHKLNDTWILQDLPENKKPIESKWVFKLKHGIHKEAPHYKARLCAKGFSQKYGIDYQEVYAPVARYDSIRIMLALAAYENLEIAQFDVKTAFLNGCISEEIYMKIPEGIKVTSKNKVCRLKKSLYGLKQASRVWSSTFDSFLKRFYFIPSKADPCVYIGNIESEKVYLIIYVDDGLILAKSKEILHDILIELKSAFKITYNEAKVYVGIEIHRNVETKTIFINQSSYVKRILKRFNMLDAKTKEIPADLGMALYSTGEVEEYENCIPYRQALGSLMFLANATRPDIAFIINYLSRFMSKYNEQHWRAIKNVLRYLKGTVDYGILYDGSIESIQVQGYSDSDYAGDLDTRRSTSGYIFMLSKGAITWGSLRQRTVSLSTMEAEYIAACEATKEALWIKQFLHDNERLCDDIITINIDNQSAIKFIKNPELHRRSKHIDVRYHFIRDKYANNDININYIPSKEQLADILTKVLSKELFFTLRAKIGVRGDIE